MDKKQRISFSKRTRTNILTGCVIALVYVLLQNFYAVRIFLSNLFVMIAPLVTGFVIAFLLNLIVNAVEQLCLSRLKNKRLMRMISLSISVIIAILIIVSILFAVIPQLIQSLSTLITKTQFFLEASEAEIRTYASAIDFGAILVDFLYGTWENALSLLTNLTTGMIPDILNTTIRFGNGIINGIISIFIAIYLLADKEQLIHHAKLVLRAFFKNDTYDIMLSAAKRSNKIFSGFITGKLLDSLIIGILCFLGMMLFKMPNALLISVIIGISNIIPTFGPFIGAIPSVLIILIDSPIKALYFAIFILVLQQFDGNVLGPFILGDSTGLSPLWVLIAICFFGSLWGIVGMLVGVPLVAIFYIFAAEFITARLQKKGYDLSNQPITPIATAQAPEMVGNESQSTTEL